MLPPSVVAEKVIYPLISAAKSRSPNLRVERLYGYFGEIKLLF